MALIERFHVVATHYPIDTSNVPTIREGMIAGLNGEGFAVLHGGTGGIPILGVFGDNTTTSSTTQLATPFSAQITLNAAGTRVFTQNRVSDPSGDETAASARITVYNGGGEFDTDLFETLDGASVINYKPGDELFVSGNSLITTNTTSREYGICIISPRAFPSGVPGTDTTDGSLSLGSFMTFKLNV
tara:strand:- start:3775 stop:4335 length:561 start_codon:yes stop_codon:yes gene_type:complete